MQRLKYINEFQNAKRIYEQMTALKPILMNITNFVS